MKLYYREIKKFDECLEALKKVETLLITRVTEFVNHSNFIDITEKLIITSKLIEEKNHLPNQGQSPILDDIYKNLQDHSYNSILLLLEGVIQTNIRQIKELLTQPTTRMPVMNSQFQYVLNELIYNHITVAEEG